MNAFNLIKGIGVVVSLVLLAGCSTSSTKLFTSDRTMLDVWDASNNPTSAMPIGSRQQGKGMEGNNTRTPGRTLDTVYQDPRANNLNLIAEHAQYSRNAQNQIHSQFTRLANPDLVMYVYPHLTGSQGVERLPVPGYSTVFPLYARAPYALPGETSNRR